VDDPSSVVIEEYLRDGLSIRLPELRPAEIAQLHFAVAWADRTRQSDAPWFAVDVPPKRLASIIESAV
jgi:hypothetical protein